jgi:hypothetical protein
MIDAGDNAGAARLCGFLADLPSFPESAARAPSHNFHHWQEKPGFGDALWDALERNIADGRLVLVDSSVSALGDYLAYASTGGRRAILHETVAALERKLASYEGRDSDKIGTLIILLGTLRTHRPKLLEVVPAARIDALTAGIERTIAGHKAGIESDDIDVLLHLLAHARRKEDLPLYETVSDEIIKRFGDLDNPPLLSCQTIVQLSKAAVDHPALTAQCNAYLSAHLDRLIEEGLEGSLTDVAYVAKAASAVGPDVAERVTKRLTERHDDLVTLARGSSFAALASADGTVVRQIRSAICSALDAEELKKRLPLKIEKLRSLAMLALHLVAGGAVEFGKALARELAVRAERSAVSNSRLQLVQIGIVASLCDSEDLAHSYLKQMRPLVVQSFGFLDFGTLAEGVMALSQAPPTVIAKTVPVSMIQGRVRKHLKGNDGPQDPGGPEAEFIRLIGSYILLTGDAIPGDEARQYLDRISITAAIAEMSPQAEATRLQRRQQQFWFGLRALFDAAGRMVILDRALVRRVRDLWLENLPGPGLPQYKSTAASHKGMISWLSDRA